MAKKNSKSTSAKSKSIKKEDKMPAKEEGNFLVLSSPGETISTGAKLIVTYICKTAESATEYINKLTGTRPEYLCVVEKKGLFIRQPKIVVKEIK